MAPGPARRDVTPEATLAVATREMPGFGEQMRRISLEFVPTAILSRQVGVLRETADHAALILNLPGQPKAIAETLEGLKGADGSATRPRHLCRRALLHRPDRRAVHRNSRGRRQGVPSQERQSRKATRMTAELLQALELQTSPAPAASVIWLHGLGADGYDFVPVVRELELLGVAGRALRVSARADARR